MNDLTGYDNKDLRRRIVDIVRAANEGHIPSSFSIVDIIDTLYGSCLNVRADSPDWEERDRFVLSKGHGAAALFSVLEKYGMLDPAHLSKYGQLGGILGGHPDSLTTPHIESSTGSLGHGFPGAVGMALGLRLRSIKSSVVVLVGDGECHEGTVWEAANVAANLNLENLIVFVDWNQSAAQLMPIDDLPAKWKSFGWHAKEIDGHDPNEIRQAYREFSEAMTGQPYVVIAHTIKGKGAALVEGHGKWHHRIPNDDEYADLLSQLGCAIR